MCEVSLQLQKQCPLFIEVLCEMSSHTEHHLLNQTAENTTCHFIKLIFRLQWEQIYEKSQKMWWTALLSFTLRASHPEGTRKTTLSTFQRLNLAQQTLQNSQKLGKFFIRNAINIGTITADSPLNMAVHGASTTCTNLPSKPALRLKTKRPAVLYISCMET